MTRADSEFDDKTKTIIAQRAGYRCSYPNCGRTLIGPGQTNHEHINIGEVAHIYSAVEKGPRTRGGLSNEELKRSENGIYLCRSHHRIIDRKANSSKYTSDMLSRMKSKHEFLISAELGEYNYPINWVSYIKVIQSPMFSKELTLNLGKVTFVYGNNGTGKSIIVNLLYSVYSQDLLPAWKKHKTQFKIETALDNPVLSKIGVDIEDGKMTYQFGKLIFPFVPYDFKVICLTGNLKALRDDVETISRCLGLERDYFIQIISTIGLKHALRTKYIEIRNIRKKTIHN